MNRSVKQKRGFTIVELMIVVAILGIIAGFAGPQFGDLMKRQALLAESKRITSLLKLARSEARARSSYVVVSHAAGSNWAGQIDVFQAGSANGYQGNRDFVADADSDIDPEQDEMIRRSKASGRVMSADASLGGNHITFSPRGWARESFSIALCKSATDKKHARIIEVNLVGKINEKALESESCSQ